MFAIKAMAGTASRELTGLQPDAPPRGDLTASTDNLRPSSANYQKSRIPPSLPKEFGYPLYGINPWPLPQTARPILYEANAFAPPTSASGLRPTHVNVAQICRRPSHRANRVPDGL
jgi:hypothetical protein